MITEMITPNNRSDFDTDAQYRRANKEKFSLLIFVTTILAALMSQQKEYEEVEAKKKSLFDSIMPKSERQAARFIRFANWIAFKYTKLRYMEACPACGYYAPRQDQLSACDRRGYYGTMKETYCLMCGELISRTHAPEAELQELFRDTTTLEDLKRRGIE